MAKHRSSSKRPVVSVVVASYNHAAFVVEALESVAAQTCPTLELIVVDDCSPDDSALRIQAWAARPANRKRFSRLVVEAAKCNAGAHNTLNRGAVLATGDYINFLNSDDFFEPSRLEQLLDSVRAENASWGFTGVRVVDDQSRAVSAVRLPPEVGFVYEGIAHAREHYPSISCGLLERNFAVSTGNLFVERQLFHRIGGFRDLKYLHDWDFILRATREAEPVAIDEPLYAYRLHGTNSFKSLANVAAIEGAFVHMENFRALAMPPSNPLAPSPHNWPVLFDHWVKHLGLAHLAASASLGR